MLRLAGTLAYMAWAISLPTPSSSGVEGIAGGLEPDAIDEQSMVGAVRLWCEYFWPHARAALRQIGLSGRHTNSRRVLWWIKANAKTEVSGEEIRREALSQSLDAEQTRQLLDSLVKSGWLREATTSTGGRPRRRWEVNPKLWGGSAGSAGSAESTMTTECGPVPELPALSALRATHRTVGQEEAQPPER